MFKFILILALAAVVTPFDIEWEANSINKGRNDSGSHGAWLEKQFGTSNPNGQWNCEDRAEVAYKIARKNGYRPIYSYEPKHVYLTLIDSAGKRYEILKKDLKHESWKFD